MVIIRDGGWHWGHLKTSSLMSGTWDGMTGPVGDWWGLSPPLPSLLFWCGLPHSMEDIE